MTPCPDCSQHLRRDGSSRGNAYYYCRGGHRWVLPRGSSELRRNDAYRFVAPPCPECGGKLTSACKSHLAGDRVVRYLYCAKNHSYIHEEGKPLVRREKRRRSPDKKTLRNVEITSENIILTCMNWSSRFTKNWEERLRASLTKLCSMAPSRVHLEPTE